MILFSVTDFIGFKLVLGTFFGIEPFFAIAIMAVSVALYVSVGGFAPWLDRHLAIHPVWQAWRCTWPHWFWICVPRRVSL